MNRLCRQMLRFISSFLKSRGEFRGEARGESLGDIFGEPHGDPPLDLGMSWIMGSLFAFESSMCSSSELSEHGSLMI